MTHTIDIGSGGGGGVWEVDHDALDRFWKETAANPEPFWDEVTTGIQAYAQYRRMRQRRMPYCVFRERRGCT